MKKIIMLFSSELGEKGSDKKVTDAKKSEAQQTVAKKEDTEEEFVHVPKEQFKEMMSTLDKIKDIDFDALKSISEKTADKPVTMADIKVMLEAMSKTQTVEYQQTAGKRVFGVSNVEIPEDDYMEVPAVFFAYTTSTTIFDDYKKGKIINAPIAPIKFVKTYRQAKKEGGKLIYNSICTATVYSKMQAEFLRNHTSFSILFFENLNDAMRTVTDVEIAALQEASNILSSKSYHEIHKMAMNYGLTIDTSDENEIRRRVILRHSKHIMQNNAKVRSSIRKESTEGYALLSKPAE